MNEDEKIKELIEIFAIEWVCPNTHMITTTYEHNAVVSLRNFGIGLILYLKDRQYELKSIIGYADVEKYYLDNEALDK